jgi:hypothetical protein
VRDGRRERRVRCSCAGERGGTHVRLAPTAGVAAPAAPLGAGPAVHSRAAVPRPNTAVRAKRVNKATPRIGKAVATETVKAPARAPIPIPPHAAAVARSPSDTATCADERADGGAFALANTDAVAGGDLGKQLTASHPAHSHRRRR